MVKIRVLPAQEGLSIHGQSLLIQNKGDLEVGNPRFLLYIKNKTYSCTTIKLQLYDYTCYGCTTVELWLYNYRGYSRTTIDFPQRIILSRNHKYLIINKFLFFFIFAIFSKKQ